LANNELTVANDLLDRPNVIDSLVASPVSVRRFGNELDSTLRIFPESSIRLQKAGRRRRWSMFSSALATGRSTSYGNPINCTKRSALPQQKNPLITLVIGASWRTMLSNGRNI